MVEPLAAITCQCHGGNSSIEDSPGTFELDSENGPGLTVTNRLITWIVLQAHRLFLFKV